MMGILLIHDLAQKYYVDRKPLWKLTPANKILGLDALTGSHTRSEYVTVTFRETEQALPGSSPERTERSH